MCIYMSCICKMETYKIEVVVVNKKKNAIPRPSLCTCTYIIELWHSTDTLSFDGPSHHQSNGLASLTDRAKLGYNIIVLHVDYAFLVYLE